jgi:hypothetical protein
MPIMTLGLNSRPTLGTSAPPPLQGLQSAPLHLSPDITSPNASNQSTLRGGSGVRHLRRLTAVCLSPAASAYRLTYQIAEPPFPRAPA